MLRPSGFVTVLRQIRQLQNIQFQNFSSRTGCRLCGSTYRVRSQQHRYQTTSTESVAAADAIPLPTPEGQNKTYPPKIQSIVNDISGLTLLEVSDLNELLKTTLNISNAPMMMAGAMPAAATGPVEEEEKEEKQEKVSYTVKLEKFDAAKKVAVIKEIKKLVPGMNLVQAKKFVESLPQTIKTDITKEEAEKLGEELTAVGGTVKID